MSARSVVAAVAASVCLISACERRPRHVEARVSSQSAAGEDGRIAHFVCTLEAWPSVIVELRDPRGRPVARGASAEIVAPKIRMRTPASEAYDSLHLGVGNRTPGTFTVRARKRGYIAAETTGVFVPGGRCGATTRVIVPLMLRPAPNARGVREVVSFTPGIGLGPGVYSAQAAVYVNAAEGVDTSVVWRSSNPSVATVDQRGVITSRCLQKKRSVTIFATSRADPRKTVQHRVEVWGDPQTCPRSSRGGK